ncbi:MAG: hypothetical protein CMH52_07095 [Myxococcales bacterium]|nr:hypothetical protein [Myxococcales bacterium]
MRSNWRKFLLIRPRAVQSLHLFLWLVMSTQLGCDDQGPNSETDSQSLCSETQCTDSTTADLGIILDQGEADGEPVDAVTDGGNQTLIRPDANPGVAEICETSPLVPSDSRLENASRVGQLATGGPLADGEWWVGDLDGTPDGLGELLIIRGGRVDALELNGRPWWRTPNINATRIERVVDLNGDGRLEVVVVTARRVHILDALDGHSLWILPDNSFGTDATIRISRILIDDFTGDEIPDIYVVDGGCNDEGSGRGASFEFANDDFGRRLALIEGDRRNGRCGRWQTFMDGNGDGLKDLVITDGRGLNLFDLRTGARLSCGSLPEAPPNGPLPHLSVGENRQFVFLENQILLQEIRAARDAECDAPYEFETVFQTPDIDAIHPPGSAAVSLPRLGGDAILTSIWTDDQQRWRVDVFGPQGQETLYAGGILLGVVGEQAIGLSIMVRQMPTRDIGQNSGRCLRLDFDQVGNLQSETPLGFCEPLRGRTGSRMSPEFRPLGTVDKGQVTTAVTLRWPEEQERAIWPDAIETGHDGGQQHMHSKGIASAAIINPTVGDGQHVVHYAYSSADGRIGFLDRSMNLTQRDRVDDGPALYQATGLGEVFELNRGANPSLISLSATGVLTRFEYQNGGFVRNWSQALGIPDRGSWSLQIDVDATPPLLVTRHPALGEDVISAFDALTGDLVWSDSNGLSGLKTMRQHRLVTSAQNETPLVLRYDRQRLDANLMPERACQVIHRSEDTSPDPECPNAPVLMRVVTALETTTGNCIWQTIIRPTSSCSGPSNQSLSVHHPHAYITESTGIVSLETDTGRLDQHTDLGRLEGGVTGRGGGTILTDPTDNGLYRTGGNGPPEKFDDALNLIWRAESIDGLRGQSWLHRHALLVGSALWVSPGAGWPIFLYNGADGSVQGVLALADGGAVDNPEIGSNFEDIQTIQAHSDIDGLGMPGVLVTTDGGRLYGIENDATVLWSRTFESELGVPVVIEPGPVSPVRLALPVGLGYIDLLGLSGPTPPKVVWDIACPLSPECDDSPDIDRSTDSKAICGRWSQVDGVDGYEYRFMGVGAVPLTDWIDAGGRAEVSTSAQQLRVGAFYQLQVRSYVLEAGAKQVSRVAMSDGVRVLNRSAPELSLHISDAVLDVDLGVQMTFELTAQDDEALAGWSLDIVSLDDGEHIKRLGGGPLNQAEFSQSRVWFGSDRFGRRVPVGRYRAEFSVIDRSQNEGSAVSPIIEICSGDCP